MAKYRIGKSQVKCLLKDKPVVDGCGRRYYAEENLKDVLHLIDIGDAYDMFDIFVENGVSRNV